jgi:hypothetical protein
MERYCVKASDTDLGHGACVACSFKTSYVRLFVSEAITLLTLFRRYVVRVSAGLQTVLTGGFLVIVFSHFRQL